MLYVQYHNQRGRNVLCTPNHPKDDAMFTLSPSLGDVNQIETSRTKCSTALINPQTNNMKKTPLFIKTNHNLKKELIQSGFEDQLFFERLLPKLFRQLPIEKPLLYQILCFFSMI